MPPLLAIVGRKHTGKTTLISKLSAELERRGYRVMIIKHGSHTFNIDPATTDTYRHFHEGRAERVAMAAPDKFALVMRWTEELGPETIAERYMADADVVLCEGFKASTLRRIEVFRPSANPELLFDPSKPSASTYLAVATDDPTFTAPAPITTIRFTDPSWLGTLATLVERQVIAVPPPAHRDERLPK